MKDLIKRAFLNFLNEYGVFVDLGEDSTDCIRRMLNKDLVDINKVALEKNCENWLDVFIELRDEMLDNKELLSVQIGDDTFLYLLNGDKGDLFDNLFYYFA